MSAVTGNSILPAGREGAVEKVSCDKKSLRRREGGERDASAVSSSSSLFLSVLLFPIN